MLGQLLREVEIHLGRKVRTKGDCQHLSDCFLEVTGDFVSYNTLRRMYGLAPSVVPRAGTLDIMSRFIGYRDYSQFVASSSMNARWHELEQALLLQSQDDLPRLLEHVSGIESNSVAVDVAIILARDWQRMEDQVSLTQLLALNRLQRQRLDYSEQLHFAHSLGLLFRTVNFSSHSFLESVHFQDNIYTMFVDYSALNGYYGEWNDWYLHNEGTSRPEFTLFNYALRILRNRLEQLPLGHLREDDIEWSGLHPILRSRIFSVLRMTDAQHAPSDLWEKVHGGHVPDKCGRLSSLHEIMFSCLLEGDAQLMGWIVDDVEVDMKNMVHHEFHDLQVYRMVGAARHLMNGEYDFCGLQLERVDLNLINLSMRDILSLLFWVLRISSGAGDLSEAWRQYQSLAPRLGHPLFDEAFVHSYGVPAKIDAGHVDDPS